MVRLLEVGGIGFVVGAVYGSFGKRERPRRRSTSPRVVRTGIPRERVSSELTPLIGLFKLGREQQLITYGHISIIALLKSP